MRIRKFNESDKYDLSFEGFKEVMSDITDDLTIEYDFHDNSTTDGYMAHSYVLEVYLPKFNYSDIDIEMVTNPFNYLRYGDAPIRHPEDGGDTLNAGIIISCTNNINKINSKLIESKSKIDEHIENNILIKNLLISIGKVKIDYRHLIILIVVHLGMMIVQYL